MKNIALLFLNIAYSISAEKHQKYFWENHGGTYTQTVTYTATAL
ncbi:hypothetical protein [Chryseobacterium indoltheticum]|nr:hypothetical protein [Chryseobacterium indoltheticum]